MPLKKQNTDIKMASLESTAGKLLKISFSTDACALVERTSCREIGDKNVTEFTEAIAVDKIIAKSHGRLEHLYIKWHAICTWCIFFLFSIGRNPFILKKRRKRGRKHQTFYFKQQMNIHWPREPQKKWRERSHVHWRSDKLRYFEYILTRNKITTS